MTDLVDMGKDTRTLRPYRVFLAGNPSKVFMGRWYIFEHSARRAAAVICLEEARPGRTIEVINVRSMTLHWTFTKGVTGNIIVKDRQKLLAEERRKG